MDSTCLLSHCLAQSLLVALQGGNLLTGSVPIAVGTTPISTGADLSTVYLDHNKLSGTLPLLATAPLFHIYDMSNNNFSGSLTLPSTAALDYATRFLALDASYGNSLDLLFGSNQLTGSLPSWLASLAVAVRRHRDCSHVCGMLLSCFSWHQHIHMAHMLMEVCQTD